MKYKISFYISNSNNNENSDSLCASVQNLFIVSSLICIPFILAKKVTDFYFIPISQIKNLEHRQLP